MKRSRGLLSWGLLQGSFVEEVPFAHIAWEAAGKDTDFAVSA